MTWIEARHGWAAVPDDVVEALSRDGLRTGSVASVVWVNPPRRARALVFIAIDGEARRDHAFSSLERDPYTDDGGES